VGEVGAENVSWDLDGGGQIHGIYQQFLDSLADSGVLIAIASKNDPAIVDEALGREDMRIPPERIFPVECGWTEKSLSIERILAAWNIAPDDVVFIDDSAMELAEVQRSFPALRCVRFPGENEATVLDLLGQLRDWFGKSAITEDDAIRLNSIRQSSQPRAALASGEAREQFLADSDAQLTVSFAKHPFDSRAFELVNKTSQFNLNGVRFEETDWRRKLAQPDTLLMVVSYTDKFGPLGKIAVLAGEVAEGALTVGTWVMSCRAFARRIEYRSLDILFEHLKLDRISLPFSDTGRNGVFLEFVRTFCNKGCAGPLSIDPAAFRAKSAPLYHAVRIHE
jgi:FkbH-like protein